MPASTAQTKTVRLRNGLDLQYRETGYPAGEPLILLHGVTDSLHAWKPFTDALPRQIRAIAITQRGHGDSSKPVDGYGSAAFAGDLAAFMDALGLAKAHICGHSMGTWVAQRFAQDYPERIESLTLICGFARKWPANSRAWATTSIAPSPAPSRRAPSPRRWPPPISSWSWAKA